jgi:cell division septal protein FtsQ
MDIHNSKDKGIIILSVIILIFIVLSVFSGVWDSEKKIKTIKINQSIIMPEKSIRDTLIKKIEGKAKSEINLDSLEKILMKEKYIHNVEIAFEGASSLRVEITEREPLALITDYSGNLHYFDNEGIILPFTFNYKPDDIFLVHDIHFDKESHNILSKIARFIEFLKNDDFRFAKSVISDITYDYKYQSVVFNTKSHHKVLLGDCRDIPAKLDNFETFLKNKEILFENQGYIDCRWDGMIVLKN